MSGTSGTSRTSGSVKQEKCDILLCGVGGQGVLSLAAVLSQAALIQGLQVRQSEVHGMAQRGGAVLAHFRTSPKTIPGDLIPRGGADIILSMEPLEALRYTDYLKPEGKIITSADPFRNISNYPDLGPVLERLGSYGARVIEAGRLAKEAGSPRAVNMVMVGAASPSIPLFMESLQRAGRELFGRKGAAVTAGNARALESGAEAAKAAEDRVR